MIFGQNARKCLKLLFPQVELVKPTGLFDFSWTHAISTHIKSIFGAVFRSKVLTQNHITAVSSTHKISIKCSKFTSGSFENTYSKLPETSHLRFRPRKSLKVDFRFENCRVGALYRYHFEWFLKLILFAHLELSKIHWGKKF